jgi:DNA (cytosine-5)-methyltransferase 1
MWAFFRPNTMTLRFGSVCSGIEAASVAWSPLGWHAAWVAEIEPFPCAVLAHHYPDVPNLGDMTTIARRVLTGEVEAPDILCGGTPCQAFSVAGLRNSLDDARGNLTLKFVELADAIDFSRPRRKTDPAIIFWENVPGVLSTKDNAFGCFLAGLAGEDDPLQPPGGKWSNAGAVYGPRHAVAWRTLDAQYFGVAQRRRRVFVVASARNGFDPATVLFEWDSLRRDTAPRREAGKVAPTIPSRSSAGGGLGTDFDCDGGLIQAFGGNNQRGSIDVATARNACASASGRMDFETETFLVQPTHTLRGEGFDASEDGTGRGTPLVPVCHVDTMPTMTAGGPSGSSHNQTSGQMRDQYIVPVAFDTTQITSQTLAFNMHKSGNAASSLGISVDKTDCLRAFEKSPFAVQPSPAMQVRRLTPTEAERLQGFPDGYTAIPWRKKPASECPDGPRYRALGNSWAVPNVRWLGRRIQAAINQERAGAGLLKRTTSVYVAHK